MEEARSATRGPREAKKKSEVRSLAVPAAAVPVR
jgi:hypothetical protein